jgi:hypothetical protein
MDSANEPGFWLNTGVALSVSDFANSILGVWKPL